MITKKVLREASLRKRKAIETSVREKSDFSLRQRIVSTSVFAEAQTIASYYPIHGEVDLVPFLQSSGKCFVFPRVIGQDLEFAPAKSRDDFMPGVYGICEPRSQEIFNIKDIDLVLVPGILFDRQGHRIGYGKGYYDRLILAYPFLRTMGVCLDEFFVDKLPAEPWDARMHFVATETEIYTTYREV